MLVWVFFSVCVGVGRHFLPPPVGSYSYVFASYLASWARLLVLACWISVLANACAHGFSCFPSLCKIRYTSLCCVAHFWALDIVIPSGIPPAHRSWNADVG